MFGILLLQFSEFMNDKIRLFECREMEEYHTFMSLKATKEGDATKAKMHARKAQAYCKKLYSFLKK